MSEVFPKIDLFPRLTKIARFFIDHHETPNSGATVVLDEALDYTWTYPEK